MSIIQEFKTFAVKGNVIDLAVAVVIGAAFGKIVNSLVDDIINPILGVFTGKIDFNDKILVLRAGIGETTEIAIGYGAFLTAIINFVVIAFAIFLVVKQINKFNKKEEVKKKAKESEEVKILKDIREILSQK